MKLSKLGKKRVLTVAKDTSLEAAAQAMREHHLGNVVVVEKLNGKEFPVGILTDRDIVMAAIALGAPTSVLMAGDIMTSDLTCISEHESIGTVVELMKTKGIKRIPIIGKEKELVGIIALEDVMQLLAKELSALSEVSSRQKELETQKRRKLA